MKKALTLLLCALILLASFTACDNSADPKEITCEEIIAAYKDAGYSVLYHGHEGDEAYNDLGIYCSFEIRDPDNEDNYMYADRYFTEEEAQAAGREQQFNVAVWLIFGMFGEWRWLHTGHYGDMVYSTFERKMLMPLQELMN